MLLIGFCVGEPTDCTISVCSKASWGLLSALQDWRVPCNSLAIHSYPVLIHETMNGLVQSFSRRQSWMITPANPSMYSSAHVVSTVSVQNQKASERLLSSPASARFLCSTLQRLGMQLKCYCQLMIQFM